MTWQVFQEVNPRGVLRYRSGWKIVTDMKISLNEKTIKRVLKVISFGCLVALVYNLFEPTSRTAPLEKIPGAQSAQSTQPGP
jgi:hypothetical protein